MEKSPIVELEIFDVSKVINKNIFFHTLTNSNYLR